MQPAYMFAVPPRGPDKMPRGQTYEEGAEPDALNEDFAWRT